LKSVSFHSVARRRLPGPGEGDVPWSSWFVNSAGCLLAARRRVRSLHAHKLDTVDKKRLDEVVGERIGWPEQGGVRGEVEGA
jgi:hypothetical protein